MKKTLIPLLVVGMFALSSLACSSILGEDPTPVPPPTNTPLPEPTAEPEPTVAEPTAEPTAPATPTAAAEPTAAPETASGPCFTENDAQATAVANVIERFGTLLESSSDTPTTEEANSLIAEMTALRSETEAIEVADCLGDYKGYSIGFMQSVIDGYAALNGDDADAAQAALENIDTSIAKMEGEVNRLMAEAGEAPIPTTEPIANSATDNTTAANGDYVLVTDNADAIQVAVPSSWNDVDGAPWVLDEETVGASIYAAPDLDAWANSFDTPGLIFNVSDDLAKQGGYVQLLDATRGYEFLTACDYDSRGNYPEELIIDDEPIEDNVYRGKFDLYFNCGGTESAYVVVAAVSNTDQFSNLLLVEVQLTSTDDLPALRTIMESFDIIGDLP